MDPSSPVNREPSFPAKKNTEGVSKSLDQLNNLIVEVMKDLVEPPSLTAATNELTSNESLKLNKKITSQDVKNFLHRFGDGIKGTLLTIVGVLLLPISMPMGTIGLVFGALLLLAGKGLKEGGSTGDDTRISKQDVSGTLLLFSGIGAGFSVAPILYACLAFARASGKKN